LRRKNCRFSGARGDALEVLELIEEVFHEVAGFVEVLVDCQRQSTLQALRDINLGASGV
jgi:hypothetical protein